MNTGEYILKRGDFQGGFHIIMNTNFYMKEYIGFGWEFTRKSTAVVR